MRSFYTHTQTGLLLRLTMLPAAVGMLAAGIACGLWLPLLPLGILLGGIGWVFSSLTVEVTAEDLSWYFGPGIWRKSVPRRAIASATPAVNKWWWGWGVHLTPRGWLYNVGGLEAVEVLLDDGATFRIGSDEAAKLAHALQ